MEGGQVSLHQESCAWHQITNLLVVETLLVVGILIDLVLLELNQNILIFKTNFQITFMDF